MSNAILKTSYVIVVSKILKRVLVIKPVGEKYKYVTALQLHKLFFAKKSNVFFNTTSFFLDKRYLPKSAYMKYLHSIRFLKFIKITITSKIYRLYINKRNDLIKSHLNYGHIIRTPLLFTTPIKQSKYKIFFYGFNFSYLKFVALRVVYTRPYNIFTARGFRLKPSIIYKKVGKVSAYR